jgi:hypothetical protein
MKKNHIYFLGSFWGGVPFPWLCLIWITFIPISRLDLNIETIVSNLNINTNAFLVCSIRPWLGLTCWNQDQSHLNSQSSLTSPPPPQFLVKNLKGHVFVSSYTSNWIILWASNCKPCATNYLLFKILLIFSSSYD